MKILAKGYARNVVGWHTVADTAISEKSLFAADRGVRVRIGKTKQIALSGHFILDILLPRDEIDRLAYASVNFPLSQRIERLEDEIRVLRLEAAIASAK